MLKLIWFRDVSQGQWAADAVATYQYYDGVWPVAEMICIDAHHADCMWDYLYQIYRVSAVYYLT